MGKKNFKKKAGASLGKTSQCIIYIVSTISVLVFQGHFSDCLPVQFSIQSFSLSNCCPYVSKKKQR